MQGKSCGNQIISAEGIPDGVVGYRNPSEGRGFPWFLDRQTLTIALVVVVVFMCLPALVAHGAPESQHMPCNNPVSAWTGTIGPILPIPGGVAVRDLAVDGNGSVLIGGYFTGTADLDPTDGLDQRTCQGLGGDAFVTKINADGSYAWTYTAGGGARYCGRDRGGRCRTPSGGGNLRGKRRLRPDG